MVFSTYEKCGQIFSNSIGERVNLSGFFQMLTKSTQNGKFNLLFEITSFF